MTDPTIAITCTANRADWLEEMARTYSGEQAALVERRILEGENRIELDYAPDVLRNRELGEAAAPPRRVVYLVPSWWRRPRDRAKVELTRWRWRRQVRLARDLGATGVTTVQDALASLDPLATQAHPQALNEVDLASYGCMTSTTAANWARRMLREREMRAEPITYPVSVTYRGVDGREYVVRLP